MKINQRAVVNDKRRHRRLDAHGAPRLNTRRAPAQSAWMLWGIRGPRITGRPILLLQIDGDTKIAAAPRRATTVAALEPGALNESPVFLWLRQVQALRYNVAQVLVLKIAVTNDFQSHLSVSHYHTSPQSKDAVNAKPVIRQRHYRVLTLFSETKTKSSSSSGQNGLPPRCTILRIGPILENSYLCGNIASPRPSCTMT